MLSRVLCWQSNHVERTPAQLAVQLRPKGAAACKSVQPSVLHGIDAGAALSFSLQHCKDACSWRPASATLPYVTYHAWLCFQRVIEQGEAFVTQTAVLAGLTSKAGIIFMQFFMKMYACFESMPDACLE